MEDTKQEPVKKERKDLAFGIRLSEFLTSLGVGAVSGLTTAASTIRTKFNEELKEWPGFKKARIKHGKQLDEANKLTESGGVDWLKHKNAVAKLKNEFAIAEEKMLLDQRGIFSKGIKGLTYGTFQRAGYAGKSAQGMIGFSALAGTFIGAAMTLSFFNGVATRDKIDKIAAKTGADNDIAR